MATFSRLIDFGSVWTKPNQNRFASTTCYCRRAANAEGHSVPTYTTLWKGSLKGDCVAKNGSAYFFCSVPHVSYPFTALIFTLQAQFCSAAMFLSDINIKSVCKNVFNFPLLQPQPKVVVEKRGGVVWSSPFFYEPLHTNGLPQGNPPMNVPPSSSSYSLFDAGSLQKSYFSLSLWQWYHFTKVLQNGFY